MVFSSVRAPPNRCRAWAIGFAARASKGLFEKVSNQLEGAYVKQCTGFVHGSMDRLRQQLSEILQSEELQESFGEARLTLELRTHTAHWLV